MLEQLLQSMMAAAVKIEEAYSKQDFEGLLNAKKEMMLLQKRAKEII